MARSPRPAREAGLVFAACAPGLEEVLERELAALGLDARAVPGGAEAGGDDAVALACLGSRVADAVALRLYQGPERGLDAALDAARSRFGARAPLAVRREGRGATLSLDAAGTPLFKRGWRARVGAAPLRESLAAGLLLALEYDGALPFLDPMCGSGTIALEAALIAARRAPGLGRSFAFERWPGHDTVRTARLRERLRERERAPPAPIHASDRNGGAVRLARKNAAAAGASEWVRIERRDAAEVIPPEGPGVCLVNPPYGVRLVEDAAAAWRAFAALLPRLGGWTVGILAPDRGLERLLGRTPARALTVVNGGLRCRLLVCRP
jgi:putative N6-adenine-specific DNA methylase